MSEIIWGSLSMEQISVNESEIAQRLKIPPDYTNVVISKCALAVVQACSPRYCYIKSPVSFSGDSTVVFEFGDVKSRNLFANLRGCDYAYVMAVTLGMDVDRLIARLGASSDSKAFIADAVASAYAEAVADYVNDILSQGASLKTRLSPGYGDFDISSQKAILEYIKADKFTGIKLGENYIMTPRKSITAICGIEK